MKCALIGNYHLKSKSAIVSISNVKVQANISCFLVIYCLKCSLAICFENSIIVDFDFFFVRTIYSDIIKQLENKKNLGFFSDYTMKQPD